MTTAGEIEIRFEHVSIFGADARVRWANLRLVEKTNRRINGRTTESGWIIKRLARQQWALVSLTDTCAPASTRRSFRIALDEPAEANGFKVPDPEARSEPHYDALRAT